MMNLAFACASLLLAAQDDLAGELPRLKPTAPAAALDSFKIQPGFRLVQVAAEPLVTDPVAACFDADQRLYVVEMGDYPFRADAPNGRVRRLEDRNNDGIYDHSTIFLDRLAWPTAIVPHQGGVFVAAAPDLIFAKDNDGDGEPEVREVVYTGFGIGNVQTLFNSLLWGLDGWIYGSSGGGGGEITRPADPAFKAINLRGRDFRFRPDGSGFEAISGGGQFGVSFDDWGHRFVCNNSNHIRQVVLESRYLERNPNVAASAILDMAVEGPAAPVFRISPPEPWRLVRTRQRAADPEFVKRAIPSELVPIGFFTSATGVTIYRGSALGPQLRGNAFVGDVGGNLVHRKRLEVAGSHFKATRADSDAEFVASTDNWFRPVSFLNTPDGTLLILDMYREAIEHPDSIPDSIKKHLDLTSGRDRGRIYNLTTDSFRKRPRLRLSAATTSELVNLLADDDSYWRETAQRLLVEKPERDTIPLLRSLLRTTERPLGKLHALWTLENLKALRFDDVRIVLNDSEPRLRENAARLLETLVPGDPRATDALIALADDDDSMVRFQAALSLGGVKSKPAVAALRKIALRNLDDRSLRAAVLSGLAGPELALHFFNDEQWNAMIAKSPPGTADWMQVWAETLARDPGVKPSDVLGMASLSTPLFKPEVARAILRGTRAGLRSRGLSFADLVSRMDPKERAEIVERAERKALSKDETPLSDFVLGEGISFGRPHEMNVLALFAPGRALEVLPKLLNPNEADAVQLGVIEALAVTEDPGVPAILLERWPTLSPGVKTEAAEVVLATPKGTRALLRAIEEQRVPVSDVDPARRKLLLEHADADIRSLAKKVFSDTSSSRAGLLKRFQPALSLMGDAAHGREIYRKVCATCHRVENEGRAVGPDLVTVAHRTPEDLLTQMLDPNREVSAPYISYVVATNDGRIHTGIIAEEGPNAITLRRATRDAEVIDRREIEEIRSTGSSLMPEDLEKQLDAQAVADLVAFIKGLAAAARPGAALP